MKKELIIYIAGLFVLTLLNSCEKSIGTYSGEDALYFYDARRLPAYSGEVLRDSTVISFSLAKNRDSIVNMIIATTGARSAQDREYKLTLDPTSTAVPGVHYTILTGSNIIKQNQLRDTVRIKFFRTTDMQTTNFKLAFYLEANENFIVPMEDKVINKTTGQLLQYSNYRWLVNDILKRPGRWLDAYLGTFSRKKLELMVEILNVDPTYMDSSISLGELLAFGKYMQRYLNEQRVAGKTIYEADGSEMIMGPSAQ